MANNYSGANQVRAINGQQFIDRFRKVSQVVVILPGGIFFPVLKRDVWDCAKENKVIYTMTDRLYIVKREVMVLVGGNDMHRQEVPPR